MGPGEETVGRKGRTWLKIQLLAIHFHENDVATEFGGIHSCPLKEILTAVGNEAGIRFKTRGTSESKKKQSDLIAVA